MTVFRTRALLRDAPIGDRSSAMAKRTRYAARRPPPRAVTGRFQCYIVGLFHESVPQTVSITWAVYQARAVHRPEGP
jgi:hypothetical protein